MNARDELFAIREDVAGHFALDGELTFASADLALKKTAKLFSASSPIVLDLAGIVRADSAGVALLLEWQRRGKLAGAKVHYVNLPLQLKAIARVTGADGILSIN